MNPVTTAIRDAAGNGPALVAYLTAGFPSREGFPELLAAVAGVADVVEIGVRGADDASHYPPDDGGQVG